VAISASTDVVSAVNVTTAQAPTAQNRYTGKNRGSYSNPELDRLYDLSLITLDQPRREATQLDLERIFTTDVAQGMLLYIPRVAAARAGIKGIVPPVRGPYIWNIWEWGLT
jgi:ABC-type transport system substrate-binding protein